MRRIESKLTIWESRDEAECAAIRAKIQQLEAERLGLWMDVESLRDKIRLRSASLKPLRRKLRTKQRKQVRIVWEADGTSPIRWKTWDASGTYHDEVAKIPTPRLNRETEKARRRFAAGEGAVDTAPAISPAKSLP